MAKTTNKNEATNKPQKPKKNYRNGIIGVMQLFAVVSICYSTATIVLGTEGVVPIVMVTPQAILAVVIAINKFVK